MAEDSAVIESIRKELSEIYTLREDILNKMLAQEDQIQETTIRYRVGKKVYTKVTKKSYSLFLDALERLQKRSDELRAKLAGLGSSN